MFLLNAIDGHNDSNDGFGDEAGWGSEEEIDLSDDETDFDTVSKQQQPEQSVPPPQENDSGTMRMGGGMFMGRLTNFLDTVAPPPQQQAVEDGWADDDVDVDVDADGWGDDDGALDNLDDSADDTANNISAYSSQAVVVPPPPPPQQNPSLSFTAVSLASSAAVGMASTFLNKTFDSGINDDDNDGAGWDDDDGLLFDDEDNSDVVNVDNAIEADISFQTAPSQSQSTPPPPPPINNANNDGWDDDGLLFDDDDVQDAPKVANAVEKEEKTFQSSRPPPPPPPPPPPIEDSIGGEDAGWDDDGLDFDDEDGEDLNKIEPSQQVDSKPIPPPPPPPPPPPVQTTVATDEGISHENALDSNDGWGDDDDLGINMSEDFDGDITEQENKNVVDHIPSPTPPRMSGDPSTLGNTDVDDDISQDDTLSIDNSRTQQQNMAPSGFRTISSSSLGDEDFDSTAEVSTSEAETEFKPVRPISTFAGTSVRISRRVVDFTPRRTRISGNDSMMVSGHTSVGESLDSIDEAEEEDYEDELDLDNAQNLRKLSGVMIADASASQGESITTPRTIESGWGALRQQNLSRPGSSASELPFGSVLTATVANNYTPNRFATINETTAPMVDHTPEISDESNVGLRGRPSVANSVDVLGDMSEGDLGETDTVGVDDIKDELYGPMVDQIPQTPRDDSPTRRARKMSSELASIASTVVGQAENNDIQNDIRDDDAMDEEEEGGEDGVDESSKGWGNALEFDNRSLLSGLPLPVVDETEYLVDHVPVDKLLKGGAASTMAMMDASMASSRAEDNVDGTNNVNFGPIVDHTPTLSDLARAAPSVATSVATGDIKDDDDMDDTTVAGGTIDSVDGEEDENAESVEQVKLEDDHIVDHVPEGKVQPTNPDASVRVLVGKEDDLTQVDTIAEDVAMEFGPIVDHTPLPFPRSTSGTLSMAASFQAQRNTADDNNTATIGSYTEADDNSGWDHDEPDLDDLTAGDQVEAMTSTTTEQNNLVDHIPSRSFAKPVDGSTIVLVDPVDAASEVDDADDDTAGNARVDKFGPVVDHTPAPQSVPLSLATSMAHQANDGGASDNRPDADVDGSVTWFGASTLGGMSSASRDDDSGTGWDEDDLGDLASPVVPRPIQTPVNDHLVDHIPSLSSPRNVDANASTAVAIDPSIVSNQTQDDKMGGGLFGAMVDHTPSVGPMPRHSTDSSTVVTGLATNTKRDEEMDETTWQGGVSAQGDGWDQDDPELEDLADNADDAPSHLVDHVPERPESRYGDPSLIVAANPSEMSSQVEDLNQDENNFGPVVDQTPLERVLPPPAVGSTVVALPSVLNDVSDEGDNDGSNVEEARVPNEWEEQIPNPQSGIDSDVTREQLVDAVPQPPLPEQQPIARDASSEMATVDDKSTLVPADEPKEDEFGPVVDHTPMGENIDGIGLGVNDLPRDVANDDKKPAATMDSVAPIYSVESKEKEDGLDEDEFGPVVDQLPAASSKSSLAPSKGGSTVDALATVSEGEDDLNTRDGWDDDTLDLVDQVSPTNLSHRGNHSVTWDEKFFNGKEVDSKGVNISKQSNDAGDSTFFTAAESNISSQSTKFYDPEESTDADGWGDDSLNIADDDTPPSTPRASMSFKKKAALDTSAINTVGMSQTFQTPVERSGNPEHMASGITENASDLRKHLHEEMAKNLLLEKESDALRKMVDTLKKGKEQLLSAAKQHVDREEELLNAISKWKEANGDLTSENSKLHQGFSKLRDESERLSTNVSNFQNENEKLSTENERLRGDFMRVQGEKGDLSAENGKLTSDNRNLSQDVLKVEGEVTDLRGKNDLLSSELESLRKSMAQLEDEKSELMSREATSSAEMINLKATLEKQRQSATSDASIREEIKLAQTELFAKVNECSQLSSKLILVEEKLRKSDAQNFKHTKDLARMTKDHVQKISSLQAMIDSRQNDIEEMKLANEKCIADLQNRLSSEAILNQKLQQENDTLLQQKDALQLQLQNSASDDRRELSEKDAEIRSLNSQLKIANGNAFALTDQVNNYAKQLEQFASISAEYESMTKERDALKEEVIDCKTHITSMQQQFNDLNSTLGLNSTKPELLVEAIQEERTKQLQEIKTLHSQISELTSRLDGIESERNAIQLQFEQYQKSHENTQSTSMVPALNSIKDEAKLKKVQGEANRLRSQLQKSETELRNSESERARLGDEVARLEAEIAGIDDITTQTFNLKEALSEAQTKNGSQAQRIELLESNILDDKKLLSTKEQEIANLQKQLNTTQSDINHIDSEKQQLLKQMEEVNAQMIQLKSDRDAYGQEMDERVAELGAGREEYAEEMNIRMDELESARNALAADNEAKDAQLHDFNEELKIIANERDVVLSEKEALEAENEEMLVQFGLLNEEMIAKETEIATMEGLILALEEERRNSIRESEDVANNVDNVDDNTKKLIEVNTALRCKIQAMASEQTAAAEQIEAMDSHKLGLNGKVEDLQNLVDNLIASFESKEATLLSTIKVIKCEKEEIDNKSLAQESDIARLHQELQTSKGVMEESSLLRRNLADMENKLSEYDRLLLQKDAAAKDLYNRLQNAGNAPAESAEMEMLRTTVKELESTVSNDKKELQELREIYGQTQQDLIHTSEQLRVSMETAQQLENDLQSKRDVESTNQILESRLDQLENELSSARDGGSGSHDENPTLQQSLEQKKNASASVREEALKRELQLMKDQMAQKDSQLASMEEKLQSQDQDLSHSKKEAEEKQATIDELKTVVEKMKMLVSESSSSQVLEENHMMSTQLVALAQAFEKSENSRAEVLEKVESERHAHAERLKQLTFNMRRFYATLKMSDV